ncbi:MAG: diadenosine tetraphosphate hydrolase [Euryarchaeota archaeon]|nr:diadenosine tetraphosphate hydrolase [Euryarchaeota archaeon]
MLSKEETIFSLIIDGKIPSYKLYEDELVIAILDINPFSPGHTLIIPKEVAITLDRLSTKSASAIGAILPKISRAILDVTGAKEFNVLQNNGVNAYQSVFHVHFHIIPKYEDGRGLRFPFQSSPINHDEAIIMSKKIYQHILEGT